MAYVRACENYILCGLYEGIYALRGMPVLRLQGLRVGNLILVGKVHIGRPRNYVPCGVEEKEDDRGRLGER